MAPITKENLKNLVLRSFLAGLFLSKTMADIVYGNYTRNSTVLWLMAEVAVTLLLAIDLWRYWGRLEQSLAADEAVN